MWQNTAISMIRFLIGDLDPDNYTYTDTRLTQLFTVAANLVLLDTTFPNNYDINVCNQDITPNPVEDTDFMSLVSLRAACVLLNSEMKASATKKITMSDGPSTISVDNSDLLRSLKDMSMKLGEKYEEALFLQKAGRQVGTSILGPYSPGSYIVGKNHRYDSRLGRNIY